MRASSLLRWSGVGAVAAAIAAVAWWPPVTDVDLAAAARGPMAVTIDEEGETRVRERYVVSAPVSGRLQRIELEPGDRITCGATIALIAPADAPLIDPRSRLELQSIAGAAAEAVAIARAERDRTVAALERAAAAERRLSNLVEIGGVSREDYERAQTAKTTAAIAVRGADHALVRAEADRKAAASRLLTPSGRGAVVTLKAPVGGVVLKRLRESEAVVVAGEPLVEIGDPGDIEIVADLLSSDAVRVRSGDAVSIERWGGAQPLAGTVLRIEPSGFLKVSALGVEEQRVNVVIGFADPLAAMRLGDGYRVDVRIAIWRADDVLAVPVGALFRSGSEWAVFVDGGGRARLRRVAIGERNDHLAQVLSGVEPDDRVVLHPPDTVGDGARIRERR